MPSFSIAFAALTVALILLWAPRSFSTRSASSWWALPLAVALAAAVVEGLIDIRALLILLLLACACGLAARARGGVVRGVAHGVMLAVSAGLFLHVLPGFDNPRVLSDVVLSPEAVPYTKYLNFDKGVAGLFLLGLYAAALPAGDRGASHVAAFLWRFVLMTAVVMVLSLGFGYVRFDPKVPEWWPLWAWSMIFLTSLPEEALFRGVVQTQAARWFGGTSRADAIAIVIAGIVFGAAHIGGGVVYVVLASVAGMGYGWIYAATRSIGAAVVAHAALNTVHFVLFTYPAFRAA